MQDMDGQALWVGKKRHLINYVWCWRGWVPTTTIHNNDDEE